MIVRWNAGRGSRGAMRVIYSIAAIWLVACSSDRVAADRPRVVAHRGLLLEAPENTLANFRACLELHLGFEIDVLRTADGKLVCIHDSTVDRTTNGSGKVSDLTLAQLQALDAGSWFSPSFQGERVPTIEQVFRLMAQSQARDVLVAVDIKQDDSAVEGELVRLARKHGVLNQLLFIGRTILHAPVRERLRQASRRAHIARVAHNSDELIGAIADPLNDWVYVRYMPSAKEVEGIHHAGKQVFIAGKSVSGQELQNWKTAAEVGMDAILTDYSLELARALRRRRP